MRIRGKLMNSRDDVFFEVIAALNDLDEVEALLDCDQFGTLWAYWDGNIWNKKWFDKKPVKLAQLFYDAFKERK